MLMKFSKYNIPNTINSLPSELEKKEMTNNVITGVNEGRIQQLFII